MRSGFSQGSQFKKQNNFRPLSTINETQLSLRGGNNQLTRPKNFEEQQKKQIEDSFKHSYMEEDKMSQASNTAVNQDILFIHARLQAYSAGNQSD